MAACESNGPAAMIRPDLLLDPTIAADLRRQPWLTPAEQLAQVAANYVTEDEVQEREEDAQNKGYDAGHDDGIAEGREIGRDEGDSLADAIEIILQDYDDDNETDWRTRIEHALDHYREVTT